MLILEYISMALFYHILVEFCISKIFQLILNEAVMAKEERCV
nr:MAG TPA: hypothetical protein [Caudoviricetes sp.]